MKKLLLMLIVCLLGAALFTAACSPITAAPPTPGPTTDMPAAPTEAPATAAPAPIGTAAMDTQPGPARFLMYDRTSQVAIAYDAAGHEAYHIATPGLDYPAYYNSTITSGVVYYFNPLDQVVMRASEDEVVRLDLPVDKNLYGISVSPDDKIIAWTIFDGSYETAHSTLWIASTDGSNVREVMTYTAKQAGNTPSSAFNLLPVGWTEDGKLLFDRAITGIGGYILFFGHNSLYSFDPTTSQIETIVPAEENHALSLDSYRLDLNRVAFNSRGQGAPVIIRNLRDQSETQLPLVAEQVLGGSIRYSPSGQWIAYATVRSNPDDEAGNVLIVPADLSADPQILLHVDGNRAPYIRGWLDEDTILFTASTMDYTQVWSVRRDGSDPKLLAQGLFFGILP